MDSRKRAHTVALVFTALITIWIGQAAAASQGVYGYWKSLDKETGQPQSIFELYADGDRLVGKIVKVFPKPGEAHDPICRACKGAQKDQPKVGLVFLQGFVRAKGEPRKWIDGTLLNPENGKSYGAEVEVSEDGARLKVYGYIRILFKIGGTNVWVRPSAEELRELGVGA